MWCNLQKCIAQLILPIADPGRPGRAQAAAHQPSWGLFVAAFKSLIPSFLWGHECNLRYILICQKSLQNFYFSCQQWRSFWFSIRHMSWWSWSGDGRWRVLLKVEWIELWRIERIRCRVATWTAWWRLLMKGSSKWGRWSECSSALQLSSSSPHLLWRPPTPPCNALQCASTAESKLQLATLPLLGAVQEIFPVGLQLMWGIFLEIADGRSGCLKGW